MDAIDRVGADGARLALAVLACLAAWWVPAAQANGTAGAALQEATGVARKWQPDATLTHVSTLSAKPDGKARSWLYAFHSPKAGKSAIVTAARSRVEIEPDVRNTSVLPIGTGFLDSDQAAEGVRRLGLKLEGDAGMALYVGGQANGKPRHFWAVTVMRSDGFSAVTIDGKDGSLVKRDDVKLK